MTERTAIVIGGGIAGLATAAGLCRTGWRVTLFEQAPEFTPVGAGIVVAPNGVRALEWLCVGDALRERSVATGAAGIRTATGRWLVRTTIDELVAQYGVPAYVLHRADLHRILLDAAQAAEMRTGQRITTVRAGLKIAEAVHEAGAEHADLVVVADGVHSTARAALFPGHPGAAYAGYLTWRGVVPAAKVPLDIPGMIVSWGRGLGFGIVPLADGRVYWFASITGPEGAHLHEDLRDVAARFADWHQPIPQLLAATAPEALLSHDIYHLPTPLPSYVAGPVALLGDAAHAMTPDLGQGACQALEDAVTLAALAANRSVPAALAQYDRIRRPRTQAMVRTSARVGRFTASWNPLLAVLRNALFRLLPTRAYLRASAAAFSWRPPPSIDTETTHKVVGDV
ncbi:FAD-dependent oxidoreductase [Mycobacterium hubeiense]|uniref:FAD-dependent oxidoreductase n=1 Tax=Mycobacterium hubeiense TaxID=1867256 RepID=UPI000C7EA2A4|nr:FAD-dependent oxidoreductase [Mycobacterium sp. QGD 101]